MARDESAPFARGETFYNGGVINLSDPLGLGGVNLEGKEFTFEPNSQDDNNGNYNSLGPDPNGRAIRVRVVRNASSINLKPKRLARFQLATAGINLGTRVDGYTTGVGDVPAGMIDEFLPTAGVPPNDLFYLVIDGPSIGTSLTTGSVSISHGDHLVPGVGTSSISADAGCVDSQVLSGATATLANNIQNCIGRSDSITQVTTTTANVPVVIQHRGR